MPLSIHYKTISGLLNPFSIWYELTIGIAIDDNSELAIVTDLPTLLMNDNTIVTGISAKALVWVLLDFNFRVLELIIDPSFLDSVQTDEQKIELNKLIMQAMNEANLFVANKILKNIENLQSDISLKNYLQMVVSNSKHAELIQNIRDNHSKTEPMYINNINFESGKTVKVARMEE